VNISGTGKDVPGGRTPFFFALRSLSNGQELFFAS